MEPVTFLTFFIVLIAVSSGRDEKRRINLEEHRKIFSECAIQHGYNDEIAMKVRAEDPSKKMKPEEYPKQFLCAKKCIDEKKGILKDGKYDVDQMKKNGFLMRTLMTPDDYFKCLSEIDSMKECEDYRKKLKCDFDSGDTHVSFCYSKLKIPMRDNSEPGGNGRSKREKNKCLEKCLWESKGILNKDGKFVPEEVAKDRRLKPKLDCLKNLEIKECEDISKAWECKKNE